jgi:cytochrome c oxidase subunit II
MNIKTTALWPRYGCGRRSPGRPRSLARSSQQPATRCIAIKLELWFEGLGLPKVLPSLPMRRPWRWLRSAPALRSRACGAAGARRPLEGATTTMLVFKRLTAMAVTILAVIAGGHAAFAALGQPSDWQIGLQQSATPVMDDIISFHNFLLYIVTGIAGFVLILLITVMVRFNARANPTPSRTTHNTTLEVAWTVVPVLILAIIAIPSFRLLFYQLNTPKADITIKATGNQWYWTYAYPDDGYKFEFNSYMLQEKDRKSDQPRLLAVDNDIVVPVNKIVRVQTIGSDVIHSFAVPSFGIKIDAIPGRLNETWFKATREGIYYGQCSELCGKDHAFMPIAVRVVSEQAFNAWVDEAKKNPQWQTGSNQVPADGFQRVGAR